MDLWLPGTSPLPLRHPLASLPLSPDVSDSNHSPASSENMSPPDVRGLSQQQPCSGEEGDLRRGFSVLTRRDPLPGNPDGRLTLSVTVRSAPREFLATTQVSLRGCQQETSWGAAEVGGGQRRGGLSWGTGEPGGRQRACSPPRIPAAVLILTWRGGGGLPQLRPHLGLQPTFLPGAFKT